MKYSGLVVAPGWLPDGQYWTHGNPIMFFETNGTVEDRPDVGRIELRWIKGIHGEGLSLDFWVPSHWKMKQVLEHLAGCYGEERGKGKRYDTDNLRGSDRFVVSPEETKR